MSDSIDSLFVKAITTIKTLSSSKHGRGLSRPPAEVRASLYGLYKQATEGNVGGLMARPTGNPPEDEANRKKWDAWKAQEGLSSKQAKKKYTALLIETMKTHATGSEEARRLLDDLQQHYDRVKDLDDTPSVYSASTFDPGRELPVYSGGVYDQSLSDRLDRSWRRDVTWTLESISEEIHAMRERYLRQADPTAVFPAPPLVTATPAGIVEPHITSSRAMPVNSQRVPPVAITDNLVRPYSNGLQSPPRIPRSPDNNSPWWAQVLPAFFKWLQRVTQRFILDFAALGLILAVVRFLRNKKFTMKLPVLRLILDFIDRGFRVLGKGLRG